jgi:uncharacterized low-complexity protein
MKSNKKNTLLAVGTLTMATLAFSATSNASNLYSVNNLGTGGQLRAELTSPTTFPSAIDVKGYELKCGESKTKEAKCGEGKCGEKGKTKEAKCGEGKCGEKGKTKEAKCGEGKCGEKGKTKEAKCGEGKKSGK